jgi:IrrE N-terminal-like domain
MNNPKTGWNASHEPQLPTSRAASAQARGVLAILRSVMPRRLLTTQEAELIAELQANRLLELAGLPQAPIPNELVTELPRIAVRLDPDLPVSGCAQWVSGRWLLSINASEPWTRQRFSLVHELKHVLDHPFVNEVYAGDEQAEHLADYFAACVLMPRRYVKRVWGERMQSLADLAQHFGVSERAMALRLQHLGLRSPVPRHSPSLPASRSPRGRYQRTSRPTTTGARA